MSRSGTGSPRARSPWCWLAARFPWSAAASRPSRSGLPGQQSQDGLLRVVPGGEIAEVAVLAQLAERGGDRAAFLVPFDDARVDIGSPGHGRGIAQIVGYLPDDPGDGALAAGFTSGSGFRHGQAHGGQDGRMPGAEVLGGVVASGYLAEVVVDVRRGDVVPARPAPVDEQLVPAVPAPPQAPDDRAHLILGHRLLALLGPLGRILEHQLALAQRDVLLPDGGQAEGAVLLRVLLAARPEEPEIDQADRSRENPVPGQAPALHVTADDLADARQHGSEVPDPIVLSLIPLLTPQVVVPVLAASGRVGADGLDVAQRVGADPDVLPGRRDHQRPDAGQRLRVLDHRRIGPQVAEAPAAAPAPDPLGRRVAAHDLRRHAPSLPDTPGPMATGQAQAQTLAPTMAG